MKKLLILTSLMLTGMFSLKAVTFRVTVPEGTQKCFVCGAFNDWNVAECPQLSNDGNNSFSLDLPEVSEADVAQGYKYLCGQDWKYVEKDANGGEISNRTSLGDPDVVGSWANDNQWDIKTFDLTINGLPREIRVYLPKGYEEESDFYPVIYYNTVQQRYRNAGDDNDNGDNFFGNYSWKAQATMENLRESTGKAYILVQICSMLGENTMSEHPDYKGSGETDSYLQAFVSDLMPSIESKYRVKKGKENTVIVGADLGALFSLYAAVNRPDIFGYSVVMSPMLWINEGDYEILAKNASEGQSYYVSAGSREPDWIINPAENLTEILQSVPGVNAYFTLYDKAAHNDDDWGVSFKYILEGIASNGAPTIETPVPGNDFSNAVYTLYAGDKSNDLQKIATMVYTEEFTKFKETNPTPAFVATYTISTDYKGDYFWNIEKGEEGSGEWVLSSPGKVGFSTKKSEDSWHTVALFEDETTDEIAAHSKAFNVSVGGATTKMTQDNGYLSKATVQFGTDKSFTIQYGSVNSGSNMGDITASQKVSDNCTEAEIIYDFGLNKVIITENNTSGEVVVPEVPEVDYKSGTYTLYAGDNQNALERIGELTFTTDFRRQGSDTPVEAFIITNDIPVKYQDYYYWNIAIGDPADANWVLSAPRSVKFSSSRKEISWQNIAYFEDKTVDELAANSKGFRLVKGTEKTLMESAGDHTVKLNVSFPGVDKSFAINYGSVNSASDMGAMTPTLKVASNCLKAEITYDFSLNKVNIVETEWGDPVEGLRIVNFSANPAVGIAGSDVNVTLELNKACDVTLTYTTPSGSQSTLPLERTGNSSYSASLSELKEGIHTLSLNITEGSNIMTNYAPLNIRILPDTEEKEMTLTVNAYEGVNWDNTGRYKANFHTHTAVSFDTSDSPSYVADKYQKAGYKILALTDHDANAYPWSSFSLYDPDSEDRDATSMGMLSIPGNELSKDRRNSWSESTGGEFNHHNDFFTGRKGQEFMSLRESYAYSQAIGGLQIINHPGQYWSLDKEYKNGEKNSPEWHAENFQMFESLIGLEVYNQGNRRPNDRILWDQILTITMPERPIWGYSCDDTHNAEQYFRNYQYMLMPDLTVDDLKDAMRGGNTVFSYEFTGSGEAKAPYVNSITVDEENKTITIDTDDADNIEWIYSTYRTGSSASSTKSAIVGYGKTFDYSNFQGSYVRARLTNSYGETAIQPFGFSVESTSVMDQKIEDRNKGLTVINHPGSDDVTLICTEPMQRITVVNAAGSTVRFMEVNDLDNVTFSKAELPNGVYVIVVATEKSAYTGKILR